MRRQKSILSKTMIAALSLVIAGAFAVMASAGSSLLSPGTSRILAGDSFDFKLNLGSVESDKDDDVEGEISEYVVSLSVSPTISALSVAEGVGSVNVVSGVYQVNSSALDGNTTLHFTVTPASDITSETTYTVSVSVKGDHVNESDSFSFVVVPVVQEDPSGGGDKPGSGESGKNMPGKGSMKAGSAKSSSSSSSSSVTYAGSWDNYLDDLSVDDYEFTRKFNKTRDTYILTVPTSVTDLTVHATASDSSAIVAITGNTDLPEGRSKIMINVTADDGSVRVYRIYVFRTDEVKEETDEEEGSASGADGQGFPEMPDGMEPPEGMEFPDGTAGSNGGSSGNANPGSMTGGSSSSGGSGSSSGSSTGKTSGSSGSSGSSAGSNGSSSGSSGSSGSSNGSGNSSGSEDSNGTEI